ncbi:ADAMTS-like protein 5 [Rhinophrynus dorsalis]
MGTASGVITTVVVVATATRPVTEEGPATWLTPAMQHDSEPGTKDALLPHNPVFITLARSFSQELQEILGQTCIKYTIPGLALLLVLFNDHAASGVQVADSRRQQSGEILLHSTGIWSTWGSWTSCSSTCGEGAAVRRRKCLRFNRKDSCTGDQRQYRICQSGVCPENTLPFRDVQCSLYNNRGIPGNHQKYQWVPFYGAPTACDLNCLAVGHNFYYTFGRVLDGTKCSPDSEGTCINGHCLRAGCDGILGSEVSTNSCGICGGQNNSCIFIQRVYNTPFPSSGFFGYKNVTRIPAGATQIKVKDQSRNILALMNSNRQYVINGDWAMSWPGVYKVAGTEVRYSRTEDSHEFMEASGPTNEDLHILVLFQEQNPGIEYEFWLPREIYQSIDSGSQKPSQQQPSDVDSWVHTTGNQRKSLETAQREDPTASRNGACGKCKSPRGRSQRIKHYCKSDFVIRAKILRRKLMGQETRYDIQVKHAYKNKFPIMHREYIWVSNICNCPELQERREYLIMASRHVNYENTLNRILLSANSYVRPWSPHEDQQLRIVNRLCAASP